MGKEVANSATANAQYLSKQHFDFVFAGFGASASLLMLELERRDLLKGKNILILDPDVKEKNDKTFCFWAEENDEITKNLQALITHSWTEAIIGNMSYASMNSYRYYHIPGINLYQEAKKTMLKNNCRFLQISAGDIEMDSEGVYVHAQENQFRAGRIFDSRPPVFDAANPKNIHLHQSFLGWVIETEKPLPENNCMYFMDFDVAQDGFTQFVYLLPYSSNSALVEFTRFGSEKIDQAGAECHLNDYILGHLGSYTIKSVESGCIPMSNSPIEALDLPGVNRLGARNYAVKPSTGYAFKNMYQQATRVADSLENCDPTKTDDLNLNAKKSRPDRFAFYDDLLLWILLKMPEWGKPVFSKLFTTTHLSDIFLFLDEKSSLKMEWKMFGNLPWKPFLLALVKHPGISRIIYPLILLLITGMMIVLGMISTMQFYVGFSLLLLGMVVVGIPHGAVDHLLESGRWNKRNAPGFIVGYLLKATAMAMLWYLFPDVALWFFLAYSAWHFGQADGKSWDFSRITSFLWGSSVLFFLLATHSSETNSILSHLSSFEFPFSCPTTALIPWLAFAVYRRNAAFAITVIWLSITVNLPLMFAFGLYFIGQHSCTSWMQICQHLKLSQPRLWIQALPFHLAAWLMLGLFLYFWPESDSATAGNRWAIFFIFIACISLPHAIEMKKVYR